MDLAALLTVMSGLVRLGPYQIVPNLLGRWIGSFPNGNVFHSTILNTAPIPHEMVLGILSHYLIGVTLTSLFVYPHVLIWHRAITFRNSLVYGIATCIFPYFLMFPAMGFGVMALNLKGAGMLLAFSLLNHAAFGIGIFVWGNLFNKPLLKTDRSRADFSGSSGTRDPEVLAGGQSGGLHQP
jgi:hypothetical protein